MFDIALMNPPYDKNLHLKFLEKVIKVAEKTVSVQPCTWITGKKKDKNLSIIANKYGIEVDILNGNKEFDAGFYSDVAVQYIDTTKHNKITVFNKEFDTVEDVNAWSNDEFLTDFINKIGTVKHSLYEEIKSSEDINNQDDMWCIKVPRIRGHVTSNSSTRESKDFYTLISNDEYFINSKARGKFSDIKKIPNNKGKLDFQYFAFETEQELDNFINYIKTDFFRTFLRIFKKGASVLGGKLKNIPWFDFSDSHFSKSPKEIDNWLFKKYNISDEIRKHIEEILPDYYNIR